MNHKSRYEAWLRFRRNEGTPKEVAYAWLQPELKSLADMYMPCQSSSGTTSSTADLPRMLRERCETLGVLSLHDVRMDEEQEREVSREIEREREVERPPIASPAPHFLHPDVVQFVRTGVVPSPSWSAAFRHIFETSFTAWSPYILATADSCQTILPSESIQARLNDYLRPVQWVISGKMRGKNALVLVSPFEANELMPEIRISQHVHLHLYIPRTTKRMKPSDDLRLYSVPPVPPWDLIDQLNILTGQLYLSDYASYMRVCRFLGVYAGDRSQVAGTVVLHNWLSNPNSTDAEIKNRFEGTPLPLAMHLLAARRGMDLAGTHMGRIIDGCPLTEEDFQSPPCISGFLTMKTK